MSESGHSNCHYCKDLVKPIRKTIFGDYANLIGPPMETCPKCHKQYITQKNHWRALSPSDRYYVMSQLMICIALTAALIFSLLWVIPVLTFYFMAGSIPLNVVIIMAVFSFVLSLTLSISINRRRFFKLTGKKHRVLGIFLGSILVNFSIWSNRNRLRKLPNTDQDIRVKRGLIDSEIRRILKKHGIPIKMNKFPIIEKMLYTKIPFTDVISEDLMKRICVTFGVTPGYGFKGKGDYKGENYEWGCQKYAEALFEADRIVLYPDIPCVVCHPRRQEEPYVELLKVCIRCEHNYCFVESIGPRPSPDVTDQRLKEIEKNRIAKETARYGQEGFEILEAARSAANAAMSKKYAPIAIGWVEVRAEINGHSVLWGITCEEYQARDGAFAFRNVLRKHGIESTLSSGLD